MAYFDEAGELQRFEAVGDIVTSDGYRLARTYARLRSELPQGFLNDMEAVHDQIVTKLDTEDPA
jgi:hypothetical protein